jgi:translation initiation factor IF-1
MPGAQPGRRSKAATARNQSRLLEVSKSEDVVFGQVLKNLGGRWMQVINEDTAQVMAHIPNSLAHRAATPIRAGDILILLPRDYEVRLDGVKKYEIFAVVQDKKQIREHIREGRIPTWMLGTKSADEDVASDAIVFDYGEGEGEGEDDDVDVDNI